MPYGEIDRCNARDTEGRAIRNLVAGPLPPSRFMQREAEPYLFLRLSRHASRWRSAGSFHDGGRRKLRRKEESFFEKNHRDPSHVV